jgi:hypothetical protein
LTDVSVVLVSRRRQRALLLQKVEHAVPSVALLLDGAGALSRGVNGPALALAGAEVVASVLVVASIARELMRLRGPAADPHHAHGIDWIDVFLSVMLATEAYAHWQETGHVRRPTVLLAALMLGLGLSHSWIAAFHARRRALRITPDGLTVGGRFFTRFTAAWPDIARIDIEPGRACIVTRDGRERRIDLGDLENHHEVRQALQHAIQAHASYANAH